MDAAIHVEGKDRLRAALYVGPDPFGPRGGTVGNVGKAKCVARSYFRRKAGVPAWMKEAETQLRMMIQFGTINDATWEDVEIEKTAGSREFNITIKGVRV